jgi:hypothetical protein
LAAPGLEGALVAPAGVDTVVAGAAGVLAMLLVPLAELPPPHPLAAAAAARRQNRVARLRMIVRAGTVRASHTRAEPWLHLPTLLREHGTLDATKDRAAGKGQPHALTYREVQCLLILDRLVA